MFIILKKFADPDGQVVDILCQAVLETNDTFVDLWDQHGNQSADDRKQYCETHQRCYTFCNTGAASSFLITFDRRSPDTDFCPVVNRQHQICQYTSVYNRHKDRYDLFMIAAITENFSNAKHKRTQLAITANAVRPQSIKNRNLEFFIF